MNKTLDRTTTQVSEEELAAHLESAQVPALIMLTAHVTGDASVLRDDWRPNLRALPSSGLDAETEAAARARCFELLAPFLPTQNTWDSVPSEELRLAMSTWLMGAPVEDALAMSEVAFIPNNTDPRQPEWKLDEIAPDTALNAVVIGAGFSGLLAGLRLKQAGVPFKIIEKSHDVGGTWWENTYPDCRTDVRSHIYTYSFTQHDWETHFGRQDKIHGYLHQFAADNGLLEHMVYGTEVTATRWNEDTNSWTLETKTAQGVGETIEATVVVSAVGQLNRPSIPNLEGIDSFKGPIVHSAQWDHSIDFTGKKVVVVGTGASALQFAPAVAKVAEQVTIFQRSAPWLRSTPVLRQEIADGERWLLNNLNQYRAYYRFSIFLPRVVGNLPAATVDPSFPPTEVSVSAANEALRKELTEYLLEQAGDDAELAKQIIPNYPPAAKRIICDDGTWVKTLKRENVRLVSQGVNRIDETGVWLGDEHIEADVILLGTGFKASDFLLPMSVAGIGGKDLHETWGIDASAYLGSTLPGFPNFFCMYGPNTNTVIHGNLVFFLECQAVYMIDAIKTLATGGYKSMNLRDDVFAEYDKEIVAESAKRTWGWSKTHSWYMNAEGRSTIMWPLPARNYFERTTQVRTEDYKLG
ncbi:flavin-containing monooxygenase [Paeniglutamicibacter kerguelensis]|uniref:4-hydroxyacetophenone monooxygenase n=1 Tax=Paeniglutamicibacter kerguelensis TaxID=254788 RepID=A0ABS4XK77_9MICC|nr:NAD(P)/FAD-dependent oxidoreductase [Paeniglutamicibacter kerguelensis]MBP2388865.1 4-hydroxyacetophenone monooxygenase [Paeniglutamicibacter kerguelensis]